MLSFVLLAPPALPLGTTTATVLCRWLTAATGTRHAFASELRDYPVFLSLHTSDASRVERLIALAYGGRWAQDGATLRLEAVRPKEGEGLAEFTRSLKAAIPANNPVAKLPPEELFRMRAGELVRYGAPEARYIRPLPKGFGGEEGVIYVRRFASGMFQTRIKLGTLDQGPFSEQSDIDFRRLPPEVEAALGDEGKATALDPATQALVQKLTQDPSAHKVDWGKVEEVDPLASMIDPVLRPVATKLKRDLVAVLPDFSIMTLASGGGNTVAGVLGRLSTTDDWAVSEGALVGRIPAPERMNRSQTRRSVLAAFVRAQPSGSVPTAATLADYLAQQSPTASECWTDAVMLVAAGVVIDDKDIGDYPYNLRFGAALSDRDWAVLRSGAPFGLAALSPSAQEALLPLLVDPIARMQEEDPATWPGFPTHPLSMVAATTDESVLIGYVAFAPQIMSPQGAGYGYARHKQDLGHEPLYQVAQRRRVKVTVTDGVGHPPLDVAFSELTAAPGSKPVPYKELPPAIVKLFETRAPTAVDAAPPPAIQKPR